MQPAGPLHACRAPTRLRHWAVSVGWDRGHHEADRSGRPAGPLIHHHLTCLVYRRVPCMGMTRLPGLRVVSGVHMYPRPILSIVRADSHYQTRCMWIGGKNKTMWFLPTRQIHSIHAAAAAHWLWRSMYLSISESLADRRSTTSVQPLHNDVERREPEPDSPFLPRASTTSSPATCSWLHSSRHRPNPTNRRQAAGCPPASNIGTRRAHIHGWIHARRGIIPTRAICWRAMTPPGSAQCSGCRWPDRAGVFV